ncbi:hypothetical protein BESB_082220 [Besnoitia besnoiti]|uniref:Protein kinase domain-containing protein n=1 Tax=Besnoitia besnoiti TaxID=94643 RepID=A0A2A9MBG9_BESBE|nr:hypothetical protein BESB_082220 [Besnoitia besnoiti]PFH33023.1 hypothetical protein BESB_082220 [Besnoitia besnoiti]
MGAREAGACRRRDSPPSPRSSPLRGLPLAAIRLRPATPRTGLYPPPVGTRPALRAAGCLPDVASCSSPSASSSRLHVSSSPRRFPPPSAAPRRLSSPPCRTPHRPVSSSPSGAQQSPPRASPSLLSNGASPPSELPTASLCARCSASGEAGRSSREERRENVANGRFVVEADDCLYVYCLSDAEAGRLLAAHPSSEPLFLLYVAPSEEADLPNGSRREPPPARASFQGAKEEEAANGTSDTRDSCVGDGRGAREAQSRKTPPGERNAVNLLADETGHQEQAYERKGNTNSHTGDCAVSRYPVSERQLRQLRVRFRGPITGAVAPPFVISQVSLSPSSPVVSALASPSPREPSPATPASCLSASAHSALCESSLPPPASSASTSPCGSTSRSVSFCFAHESQESLGGGAACRAFLSSLAAFLFELELALAFLSASFFAPVRRRESRRQAPSRWSASDASAPRSTPPTSASSSAARAASAAPGCASSAPCCAPSSARRGSESGSFQSCRGSEERGAGSQAEFLSRELFPALLQWVGGQLAAECATHALALETKQAETDTPEGEAPRDRDAHGDLRLLEEEEGEGRRGGDVQLGEENFSSPHVLSVLLLTLAIERNPRRLSTVFWNSWLDRLRISPSHWQATAVLPLLLTSSEPFLQSLLETQGSLFSLLGAELASVHAAVRRELLPSPRAQSVFSSSAQSTAVACAAAALRCLSHSPSSRRCAAAASASPSVPPCASAESAGRRPRAAWQPRQDGSCAEERLRSGLHGVEEVASRGLFRLLATQRAVVAAMDILCAFLLHRHVSRLEAWSSAASAALQGSRVSAPVRANGLDWTSLRLLAAVKRDLPIPLGVEILHGAALYEWAGENEEARDVETLRAEHGTRKKHSGAGEGRGEAETQRNRDVEPDSRLPGMSLQRGPRGATGDFGPLPSSTTALRQGILPLARLLRRLVKREPHREVEQPESGGAAVEDERILPALAEACTPQAACQITCALFVFADKSSHSPLAPPLPHQASPRVAPVPEEEPQDETRRRGDAHRSWFALVSPHRVAATREEACGRQRGSCACVCACFSGGARDAYVTRSEAELRACVWSWMDLYSRLHALFARQFVIGFKRQTLRRLARERGETQRRSRSAEGGEGPQDSAGWQDGGGDTSGRGPETEEDEGRARKTPATADAKREDAFLLSVSALLRRHLTALDDDAGCLSSLSSPSQELPRSSSRRGSLKKASPPPTPAASGPRAASVALFSGSEAALCRRQSGHSLRAACHAGARDENDAAVSVVSRLSSISQLLSLSSEYLRRCGASPGLAASTVNLCCSSFVKISNLLLRGSVWDSSRRASRSEPSAAAVSSSVGSAELPSFCWGGAQAGASRDQLARLSASCQLVSSFFALLSSLLRSLSSSPRHLLLACALLRFLDLAPACCAGSATSVSSEEEGTKQATPDAASKREKAGEREAPKAVAFASLITLLLQNSLPFEDPRCRFSGSSHWTDGPASTPESSKIVSSSLSLASPPAPSSSGLPAACPHWFEVFRRSLSRAQLAAVAFVGALATLLARAAFAEQRRVRGSDSAEKKRTKRTESALKTPPHPPEEESSIRGLSSAPYPLVWHARAASSSVAAPSAAPAASGFFGDRTARDSLREASRETDDGPAHAAEARTCAAGRAATEETQGESEAWKRQPGRAGPSPSVLQERGQLGRAGGGGADEAEGDAEEGDCQGDDGNEDEERDFWQLPTAAAALRGEKTPVFWDIHIEAQIAYFNSAVAPALLAWLHFFFEPPSGVFHLILPALHSALFASFARLRARGAASEHTHDELGRADASAPSRCRENDAARVFPRPPRVGDASCAVSPSSSPSPSCGVSSCSPSRVCASSVEGQVLRESAGALSAGFDREEEATQERVTRLIVQVCDAGRTFLALPPSRAFCSAGEALVAFVDLHYLLFLLAYCSPGQRTAREEEARKTTPTLVSRVCELHLRALVLIAAKRPAAAMRRFQLFRVLDFLAVHLLSPSLDGSPCVSGVARTGDRSSARLLSSARRRDRRDSRRRETRRGAHRPKLLDAWPLHRELEARMPRLRAGEATEDDARQRTQQPGKAQAARAAGGSQDGGEAEEMRAAERREGEGGGGARRLSPNRRPPVAFPSERGGADAAGQSPRISASREAPRSRSLSGDSAFSGSFSSSPSSLSSRCSSSSFSSSFSSLSSSLSPLSSSHQRSPLSKSFSSAFSSSGCSCPASPSNRHPASLSSSSSGPLTTSSPSSGASPSPFSSPSHAEQRSSSLSLSPPLCPGDPDQSAGAPFRDEGLVASARLPPAFSTSKAPTWRVAPLSSPSRLEPQPPAAPAAAVSPAVGSPATWVLPAPVPSPGGDGGTCEWARSTDVVNGDRGGAGGSSSFPPLKINAAGEPVAQSAEAGRSNEDASGEGAQRHRRRVSLRRGGDGDSGRRRRRGDARAARLEARREGTEPAETLTETGSREPKRRGRERRAEERRERRSHRRQSRSSAQERSPEAKLCTPRQTRERHRRCLSRSSARSDDHRPAEAFPAGRLRRPFIPPLRLDALPPPASYRDLQQPPSEAGAVSYGPTPRPPTGKAVSSQRLVDHALSTRHGGFAGARRSGGENDAQAAGRALRSGDAAEAPAERPPAAAGERQAAKELGAATPPRGRDGDERCASETKADHDAGDGGIENEEGDEDGERTGHRESGREGEAEAVKGAGACAADQAAKGVAVEAAACREATSVTPVGAAGAGAPRKAAQESKDAARMREGPCGESGRDEGTAGNPRRKPQDANAEPTQAGGQAEKARNGEERRRSDVLEVAASDGKSLSVSTASSAFGITSSAPAAALFSPPSSATSPAAPHLSAASSSCGARSPPRVSLSSRTSSSSSPAPASPWPEPVGLRASVSSRRKSAGGREGSARRGAKRLVPRLIPATSLRASSSTSAVHEYRTVLSAALPAQAAGESISKSRAESLPGSASSASSPPSPVLVSSFSAFVSRTWSARERDSKATARAASSEAAPDSGAPLQGDEMEPVKSQKWSFMKRPTSPSPLSPCSAPAAAGPRQPLFAASPAAAGALSPPASASASLPQLHSRSSCSASLSPFSTAPGSSSFSLSSLFHAGSGAPRGKEAQGSPPPAQRRQVSGLLSLLRGDAGVSAREADGRGGSAAAQGARESQSEKGQDIAWRWTPGGYPMHRRYSWETAEDTPEKGGAEGGSAERARGQAGPRGGAPVAFEAQEREEFDGRGGARERDEDAAKDPHREPRTRSSGARSSELACARWNGTPETPRGAVSSPSSEPKRPAPLSSFLPGKASRARHPAAGAVLALPLHGSRPCLVFANDDSGAEGSRLSSTASETAAPPRARWRHSPRLSAAGGARAAARDGSSAASRAKRRTSPQRQAWLQLPSRQRTVKAVDGKEELRSPFGDSARDLAAAIPPRCWSASARHAWGRLSSSVDAAALAGGSRPLWRFSSPQAARQRLPASWTSGAASAAVPFPPSAGGAPGGLLAQSSRFFSLQPQSLQKLCLLAALVTPRLQQQTLKPDAAPDDCAAPPLRQPSLPETAAASPSGLSAGSSSFSPSSAVLSAPSSSSSTSPSHRETSKWVALGENASRPLPASAGADAGRAADGEGRGLAATAAASPPALMQRAEKEGEARSSSQSASWVRPAAATAAAERPLSEEEVAHTARKGSGGGGEARTRETGEGERGEDGRKEEDKGGGEIAVAAVGDGERKSADSPSEKLPLASGTSGTDATRRDLSPFSSHAEHGPRVLLTRQASPRVADGGGEPLPHAENFESDPGHSGVANCTQGKGALEGNSAAGDAPKRGGTEPAEGETDAGERCDPREAEGASGERTCFARVEGGETERGNLSSARGERETPAGVLWPLGEKARSGGDSESPTGDAEAAREADSEEAKPRLPSVSRVPPLHFPFGISPAVSAVAARVAPGLLVAWNKARRVFSVDGEERGREEPLHADAEKEEGTSWEARDEEAERWRGKRGLLSSELDGGEGLEALVSPPSSLAQHPLFSLSERSLPYLLSPAFSSRRKDGLQSSRRLRQPSRARGRDEAEARALEAAPREALRGAGGSDSREESDQRGDAACLRVAAAESRGETGASAREGRRSERDWRGNNWRDEGWATDVFRSTLAPSWPPSPSSVQSPEGALSQGRHRGERRPGLERRERRREKRTAQDVAQLGEKFECTYTPGGGTKSSRWWRGVYASSERGSGEDERELLRREADERLEEEDEETRIETRDFLRCLLCTTSRHLGLAGCRLLKLVAAEFFPQILGTRETKLGTGTYGSVWQCTTAFREVPFVAVKQVSAPMDEKSHLIFSSIFHEVVCLDTFRLASPLVAELFDFGLSAHDGLLTYAIQMKLYGSTLGSWRRSIRDACDAQASSPRLPGLEGRSDARQSPHDAPAEKDTSFCDRLGELHEDSDEEHARRRRADEADCAARSSAREAQSASERAAGRESFFVSAPDGMPARGDEGDEDEESLEFQRALLPLLLGIFRQIACAVAKLHAKGITHCDLKCDNVLVDFTTLLPVPGQATAVETAERSRKHGARGAAGSEGAAEGRGADREHACGVSVSAQGCESGTVSGRSLAGGEAEAEEGPAKERRSRSPPRLSAVETERRLRRFCELQAGEAPVRLVPVQLPDGPLLMPQVAVADFGEACLLSRSAELNARSRGTEVNKSPELLHVSVVVETDETDYESGSETALVEGGGERAAAGEEEEEGRDRDSSGAATAGNSEETRLPGTGASVAERGRRGPVAPSSPSSHRAGVVVGSTLCAFASSRPLRRFVARLRHAGSPSLSSAAVSAPASPSASPAGPLAVELASPVLCAASSEGLYSPRMAADVWALGCVFYELVTSHCLFLSNPCFYLRLSGRLPLLDDVARDSLDKINPLLAPFLLLLLQRSPRKRPAAAQVVALVDSLLCAVLREGRARTHARKPRSRGGGEGEAEKMRAAATALEAEAPAREGAEIRAAEGCEREEEKRGVAAEVQLNRGRQKLQLGKTTLGEKEDACSAGGAASGKVEDRTRGLRLENLQPFYLSVMPASPSSGAALLGAALDTESDGESNDGGGRRRVAAENHMAEKLTASRRARIKRETDAELCRGARSSDSEGNKPVRQREGVPSPSPFEENQEEDEEEEEDWFNSTVLGFSVLPPSRDLFSTSIYASAARGDTLRVLRDVEIWAIPRVSACVEVSAASLPPYKPPSLAQPLPAPFSSSLCGSNVSESRRPRPRASDDWRHQVGCASCLVASFSYIVDCRMPVGVSPRETVHRSSPSSSPGQARESPLLSYRPKTGNEGGGGRWASPRLLPRPLPAELFASKRVLSFSAFSLALAAAESRLGGGGERDLPSRNGRSSGRRTAWDLQSPSLRLPASARSETQIYALKDAAGRRASCLVSAAPETATELVESRRAPAARRGRPWKAEAFSCFLPVLFDFLREAAAAGARVLFLDDEAAGAGEDGGLGGESEEKLAKEQKENVDGNERISVACAIALVIEGFALDPFRAASLLSAQCISTPLTAGVRDVLSSLFRERTAASRKQAPLARPGATLPACFSIREGRSPRMQLLEGAAPPPVEAAPWCVLARIGEGRGNENAGKGHSEPADREQGRVNEAEKGGTPSSASWRCGGCPLAGSCSVYTLHVRRVYRLPSLRGLSWRLVFVPLPRPRRAGEADAEKDDREGDLAGGLLSLLQALAGGSRGRAGGGDNGLRDGTQGPLANAEEVRLSQLLPRDTLAASNASPAARSSTFSSCVCAHREGRARRGKLGGDSRERPRRQTGARREEEGPFGAETLPPDSSVLNDKAQRIRSCPRCLCAAIADREEAEASVTWRYFRCRICHLLSFAVGLPSASAAVSAPSDKAGAAARPQESSVRQAVEDAREGEGASACDRSAPDTANASPSAFSAVVAFPVFLSNWRESVPEAELAESPARAVEDARGRRGGGESPEEAARPFSAQARLTARPGREGSGRKGPGAVMIHEDAEGSRHSDAQQNDEKIAEARRQKAEAEGLWLTQDEETAEKSGSEREDEGDSDWSDGKDTAVARRPVLAELGLSDCLFYRDRE